VCVITPAPARAAAFGLCQARSPHVPSTRPLRTKCAALAHRGLFVGPCVTDAHPSGGPWPRCSRGPRRPCGSPARARARTPRPPVRLRSPARQPTKRKVLPVVGHDCCQGRSCRWLVIIVVREHVRGSSAPMPGHRDTVWAVRTDKQCAPAAQAAQASICRTCWVQDSVADGAWGGACLEARAG